MSLSPLLKLPLELWIMILARLDEQDLKNLNFAIPVIFQNLINDNELWKQIFKQLYNTIYFTNLSKSNNYYDEFCLKLKYLKEWKHNRGIKTKYTISTHANGHGEVDQVEHLVFEYPKLATYNNGVITILNLENNLHKKASRMTYIPCTSPQGCSTMNFNLHAANFGRYDGRVFGKNLTNKSYLSPVIEYDSIHSTSVSSVASFSNTNKSDDLYCCSGDFNGQLIWWLNSKKFHQIQLSNFKISHIFLPKRNTTVVIDASNRLYLIIFSSTNEKDHFDIKNIAFDMKSTALPIDARFEISQVKVDYGGRNLIVCDNNNMYIVSVDQETFGEYKKYSFGLNENIQHMTIDETTAMKKQDIELIGYDGCYVSILTEQNNNTIVYVFNIRSPLKVVKPQCVLPFQEKCYVTCVNNVVLLVAFEKKIGIFNALNGDELRVNTKLKEKYPQFLKMSHGKIVIGSNDTFQFLQYVKDIHSLNSRQAAKSRKPVVKSLKSSNAMSVQFDEYQLELNEQLENEKYQEMLKTKYGGTVDNGEFLTGNEVDDEEMHLRIALMESQAQQTIDEHQRELDEQQFEEAEMLRLAIEASKQQHHPRQNFTQNSVPASSLFGPHVTQSVEPEVREESFGYGQNGLTEEEELALALEMSMREC